MELNPKRRLADLVMPWAARNASVWPSQHAAHQGLLEDHKDALKDAQLYRDAWIESNAELTRTRQLLTRAVRELDRQQGVNGP